MRLGRRLFHIEVVLLLPIFATLAACGDSNDTSTKGIQQHGFTAEQSELVADLSETHPGLLIHAVPASPESEESHGGVHLTVSDNVDITDEFVGDVVELNQTLPITMVQLLSDGLMDDNLEFLHELSELEMLKISSRRIDDQSLRQVTSIESLRAIEFGSSGVTDEGIASLANMSQLQSVAVPGAKRVDGSGFAKLVGRVDLLAVNLIDTRFGDDGCLQLAKFPNLRVILIANTKVTDRGIRHFSAMSKIEYLNVANTAVTDKGIAALKKALPKLKIDR